MSFEFLNQLPTPADIKRDYPLSPELRELKKHRDLMISDVITGKDSRVLVIIGPCSADNEDSVCDYVSRLTSIQEDVKDYTIWLNGDPAKMDQEEILGRIRPYLGDEARIKVEIVDEIPVLASGKRKYIENRCEKYQDHKGICG